jgi:hypothetical protein
MRERIKYQGVEICKREEEVIRFIETGSNNFWDSYYNYSSRKKRLNRPTLTIKSWFNKTIRGLQDKELLMEIPFVLGGDKGLPYIWANPGLNASKANFECITLQDDFQEQKGQYNKII